MITKHIHDIHPIKEREVAHFETYSLTSKQRQSLSHNAFFSSCAHGFYGRRQLLEGHKANFQPLQHFSLKSHKTKVDTRVIILFGL